MYWNRGPALGVLVLEGVDDVCRGIGAGVEDVQGGIGAAGFWTLQHRHW